MSIRTIEPTNPTPPAGWRRTPHPLRIAILGWARLAAQGREGSGYNLNCSELAAGLSLSGHRVSYLRSGMTYSIRPGMRISPLERWRGIACYDLINSPNLSPASSNFTNMAQEMSSPDQSRLVVQWLDAVGAQVVHVHSLEGYGLDTIQRIRESGRPVVITPHNYWYGCPQVDLLRHETDVCMDYEGGRACVGCLPPVNIRRLKTVRGIEQSAERAIGGYWSYLFKSVYLHVKPRLGRIIKRRPKDEDEGPTVLAPDGVREFVSAPVDEELALGYEVDDAAAHSGRVMIEYPTASKEKPVQLGRSPADQNERFVSSDVHLRVVNDYGRRRASGIDALNAASLVTPPSRFVLRAMEAMGMDPQVGRHVRLGQPHFDQINRSVRRSPYYDRPAWTPADGRPLRLGFWGTTRNNKGVEILVQAILNMPRDVRQRCHFLIHAAGWDWPFRKRLLKFPEVSFWGGYDPLHLIGGAREFDVGVLPFVWFENSPLVLLEFLHAGKFVISSRLGGPPEWIVEPGQDHAHPLGNGLCFPGGDSAALSDRIAAIVSGSVALPSARQVHQISQLRSYPEHVAEVESIYHELVGNKAATAAVSGGRAISAVDAGEPVAAALRPAVQH
ncbi:MAG: hypothetical protein AMXMBFR58_02810 [Phycisphaerae bacterium]